MTTTARLPPFVLLVCCVSAYAQTGYQGPGPLNQNYREDEPWQEETQVPLPTYPGDPSLVEIYVGPVATAKFYVDASTLSVGKDGIVRYVLVVKTSGGATNTSYEGIHCAEHRWKLYATGRSDRTWSLSRALRNDWRPIEKTPTNPYHAELSRSYFCPDGNAIATPEEGRDALRRGKHPSVN